MMKKSLRKIVFMQNTLNETVLTYLHTLRQRSKFGIMRSGVQGQSESQSSKIQKNSERYLLCCFI